jgi:hypothetical protein
MTRDDIIGMAKEAEAWSLIDHDGIAALERFANLVAAAEREACAKVAEAYEPRCDICPSGVAFAIRERGAP